MTSQQSATPVLKEGDTAPRFTLPVYPFGEVSLDEFKGKSNVILAFYPMDDTPGCTKEMCAFSSDLSQFESANTVVLGISCDSIDKHDKFASKYMLRQRLISDEKGEVGKAYGAISGDRTSANRVLFVIDKEGVIRHVHSGMPDNIELLEVLQGLD